MQSNVTNFKLFLDISATATPDYQELKIMSLSSDKGEVLDTWNDLSSSYANNVRVAQDLTFSVTAKLDSSDAVGQFVLGKEYSVGVAATCGTRIVNLLKGSSGKQLDFDGTVSNITWEATPDAVLELSFDLKVYDNSTVVESDYVTPSV